MFRVLNLVMFYPNFTTDPKDIVWTSSDEAVATVDENGLVDLDALEKAKKLTWYHFGENHEYKSVCNAIEYVKESMGE